MADKYIVTGTTNRSRSGTQKVIFEKDENGQATKFISKTHASELKEEDKKVLKSLGVTYEKVSAEDAAKLEQESLRSASVGSDVAGAAPTFGGGTAPNTTPTDDKSSGGDSSSGGGK